MLGIRVSPVNKDVVDLHPPHLARKTSPAQVSAGMMSGTGEKSAAEGKERLMMLGDVRDERST